MTSTISIRCNACHETESCPQCRALNAERDARFTPPADHGRAMTLVEILNTVERIVADQIDASGCHEAVSPAILRDGSLLDIGADELDTTEILMRAEETFGVELSDGDVTLVSTVSDIAAVVTVALRAKEAREVSPQIVCCGCGKRPPVGMNPPICAECGRALTAAGVG